MPVNFSTSRKPLSTFSLAGLTDIVLLLLVFFLLTSNFIPQFGIRVDLPQADAAAPSEGQYVSVAITEDGRFYVDSRQVPREALLEAIRQAQGTRTALLLRADEDATIKDFAYVGNIAKALQMRVLMATEREGLR
ncbi:MAG: biopolymer transporter ExbD [Bacteroidetes bacterium]|nr:biopolymer transporter ExbD [Rhodothermaceae bacterium RA]RMH58372.1 MAG: biopolymer transporter ExbD [Bacteroidota bacterium]